MIRMRKILFTLFIAVFALNVFAQSAADSKEDGSDKAEVQSAYEAWCKTIGTAKGDPTPLLKFYAPGALLLPTLSPRIYINQNGGLQTYFNSFLSKPNLKCRTEKLITQLEGDVAINSGFYTFSFSEDGKTKVVSARFTFVYKKEDDVWSIINHHSSVLPS